MGGSGIRFGGASPKQFLPLAGDDKNLPLFAFTLFSIVSHLELQAIVLVVPQEYLTKDEFILPFHELKVKRPEIEWFTVAGGKSRHESFCAGAGKLFAEKGDRYQLLVHDANRPWLPVPFLTRVSRALEKLCPETPAFIPAVPIADSVVRVEHNQVLEYVPRDELRAVQTPQLVHGPTLKDALAEKKRQEESAGGRGDYTDEGSFFSNLGFRVIVFDGDASNRKITYPEDVAK